MAWYAVIDIYHVLFIEWDSYFYMMMMMMMMMMEILNCKNVYSFFKMYMY